MSERISDERLKEIVEFAPNLGGSKIGTATANEIREVAEQLLEARAREKRLRNALERLRDCDWVISLPDRMDPVREVARAALSDK